MRDDDCQPGGGAHRASDARVRTTAAVIGLLVALLFLALVATTPAGAQAAAACNATPTEVAPGEAVSLDASASGNASSVEFDVDGDGTYDRVNDTDFVIQTQYDQPGTYEPSVRVAGDANDSDTAFCGEVQVVANQPPDAQLVADPGTADVGETVTLDASESTDPDGTIVEYRWDVDGDGTVDREGQSSTIEHPYEAAGNYRVRVTVVDDGGANASAAAPVVIDARPPVAACSVDPATVAIGETVSIDASGSNGADAVDVDVDGDGTIDRTLTASFETTASYDDSGTVEPTVTARNDAGEDRAVCGQIEVQPAGDGTGGGGADGEEDATGGTDGADGPENDGGDGGILVALQSAIAGDGDGGPGTPRHLGGTVLLLGAAGWLLGRARQASDDPRPRGIFEWRSDVDERFATGLLDADDGDVAVEIGFEPDLVLLAARSNGGHANSGDGAPGAALSNGVVLRTEDGIRQHAIGAAAADGAAVVRGSGDDARRGRVTATSETGFELDADDGLDATVCYRAIRLPADVTATVGTATVAAGDDTARLPATGPIDALLLDAAGGRNDASGSDTTGSGSSGTEPDGAGWISVGTAVGDGIEQTAIGERDGKAADGAGSGNAVVAPDRALALGEDGPRARLVVADSARSLAYDDPASVEHVLQFVALAGVPALAPATGTVEVTIGEAETAAPVGFEPAFVEYWVVPGPSAAEGSATDTVSPGGVSFGTALVGADGIERVSLGVYTGSNDRPAVSVESFTDDGVAFAATAGDEAATTSVTVAYRAWPGPLDRRRDAGGTRS